MERMEKKPEILFFANLEQNSINQLDEGGRHTIAQKKNQINRVFYR